MTEIDKQIAGMRDKLLEYKRLLRGYRKNERFVRDSREYIALAWKHEERLRIKLERALWNVVHDSPKTTAEEIKLYLSKVLTGLGL